MKKNTHLFFLVLIICLNINNGCFAQNVGINATGSVPNASAGLDIDFTNKGILIPRLTSAQRDSISNPAKGLEIFNNTTNCFEVYNHVWQTLNCTCTGVPSAAGSIAGTAAVCLGQNAVLYSVPAITGATGYVWSYSGTGATIVGSGAAIIIYFSETATSGNLTVAGTNACGSGAPSVYDISVSAASGITGQPSSPSAVCAGNGSAAFMVSATGTSLTYQWQEYITSWINILNVGVYSGVTTATLTITNPTASMNSYKYRCVVTGTCTSTTSDGAATLTVNAIPTLTSSLSPSAICSGTTFSYTPAGPVSGTSFAWSRATAAGISNSAATGTGNPNEILTNTTSAPVNVTYIYTLSANGCTNSGTYSVVVAVNPIPTLTSSLSPAGVCSNTVFSYTPTSATSGAGFAWSRATVAGISNGAATGTDNPNETLSNTSGAPVNVTYVYTITANSCNNTQNVVVPVSQYTYTSSNQTFNYSGNSVQPFSVPNCVSSITINGTGAIGGTGGNGGTPGYGGSATGKLAVTPGAAYYVFVGGAGASGGCCNNGPEAGGYGGGGNGGSGGLYAGGGGGGMTWFSSQNAFSTSTVILVAGGGGGGAQNTVAGGNGGGLTGVNGQDESQNAGSSVGGGKGGSQSSGGNGGTGDQNNGTAGGPGTGGTGGAVSASNTYNGGGGGGGYYGGGGGGGGGNTTNGLHGGGGGGSSYLSSALINTSTTPGANSSGNGSLTISW